MAKRADPEETLQFVTFQPWPLRIAIGIVFLVLIVVAADLVPDGPYLLTTGPVFVVGYTALSFAVHRSVVLRLEDQGVRIRLGRRTVEIPYEEINEAAVGPRTPWWKIGRRRLDDGAAGYLMGGPSVRISTAREPVVVSAEESYRVAGAIERQRTRVIAERAAGTEPTGR